MNMGLRRSRMRTERAHEEVNPLEGVVNIVDAMLVFACGLMLSLIINWNVDIGQEQSKVEMTQGQDVSGIEGIKDNLIESKDKGKLYQKMGTVYKDPATGKLFMLTDK